MRDIYRESNREIQRKIRREREKRARQVERGKI